MRTTGERLKQIRAAYQMTQEEFAERAGISRTAYNNYENDVRRPSLDEAFKIVQTYGTSLDYIYLGRVARPGPGSE